MEDIENPVVVKSPVDVKSNAVGDGAEEISLTAKESDVCHKSNGVVDAPKTEIVVDAVDSPNETTIPNVEVVNEVHESLEDTILEPTPIEPDVVVAPVLQNVTDEVPMDATCDITNSLVNADTKPGEESIETMEHLEDTVITDYPDVEESVVEVDGVVESTNDGVIFKTEIVVESNINDANENNEEEVGNVSTDNGPNLVNELGQNEIELSEMLRSSDTIDNVENNNRTTKQEVFNKEELLDILEGNDADVCKPRNKIRPESSALRKPLEHQLALQQLSRLSSVKKRKYEKKLIKHRKEAERKVEENIVTELVKEWEDDDSALVESPPKNIIEESESLLKSTNDLVKAQDNISQDKTSIRTSLDCTSDKKTSNLNKNSDEGLPQRRLGRIIKKKVIFDPDNPDTFTKGKSAPKNKELLQDKEQPPIKKIKNEPINQQPKARSPLSKLQWKKPTPRNSRRLTEVDKLLMDEGAVNMIYQLTPEADKGKKNMKTKAEFIKNLQRSTPDSKEMKFRERKKDSKSEDGEPRRIAGGKQRTSLSGSVKSPSVCEDFEAHSADDSIIYRRHSSSSYSSSCMSPRRLSDVESGAINSIGKSSQKVLNQLEIREDKNIGDDTKANISMSDTFMTENTSTPKKLINKNDCLSIKEKLNSKLSLALKKQGITKRKQDSTVVEKAHKQKKVSKHNDKEAKCDGINDFKYLSINIDNKLGEICIKKSGIYDVEVIQELNMALTYLNSKEDISVTLLTSECGTICSGLDLRPLLNEDLEMRTKYALDLAESVRSLLLTMDLHSKLLCTGIGNSCSSVGLALVAMSDVTLASELASFSLDADMTSSRRSVHAPLVPGLSVLIASNHPMSKALVSDIMVLGRRLSASDAKRYGLVSNTLWPDHFPEQLHNIAKDIAIQPVQNLALKKQLLNLKKSEHLDLRLERERDMFVHYWLSTEGQKIIRATYETT